jgi:hypothetical protein
MSFQMKSVLGDASDDEEEEEDQAAGLLLPLRSPVPA